MLPPGSDETLGEKINLLLSKELPDALVLLSKRPDSFTQAIQYLEGAYADVQASGSDKDTIVLNAKSIVSKGLLTVINDIEKASNALSQLVDMQSIAVSSSISSTIEFIDHRLSDVREQQSAAEFQELKCNSMKALHPAAVVDLDSSPSIPSTGNISFRRIPLEQREMKSTSVLLNHKGVKHLDLFSMEKGDVSKNLFGQIQWEEILRGGVFLEHRDHQLLEKSQSSLDVVIDNPQDAKDLSGMLLKISDTPNLIVQQYAFTRIEEILGVGLDYTSSDAEAFGIKHAHLFTSDGVHLLDSSFVKALLSPDIYLQRSASMGFACLLTATEGSIDSLINWINGKLQSTSNGVSDMALPALAVLTKSQFARNKLISSGVVNHVVAILRRLGANGNAQQIYELCFILWALSLVISSPSRNGEEVELKAFLSSGAVQVLAELLVSSPTKKVSRMVISALKNLSATENDAVLSEMLAAGLLKQMDILLASNILKFHSDIEVDTDFKALHDVLVKNYRELSTFDRWATEVKSTKLRWGILHTEKFWKENAKFVEADNFKLLKTLIQLTQSADETIACVALYDIGEFTRYYPNGRALVSKLGGKDAIMPMLGNSNEEIQRQALQCISKIMVTNWEFLR